MVRLDIELAPSIAPRCLENSADFLCLVGILHANFRGKG